MRIGEILSLKKEDIELEIAEPVIHVRSSFGRRKKGGRISPDDEIISDRPENKTFLVRSSTKTYTSTRNIPIVGELNQYLRRQFDTVRGYRDYAEETYNERGFVFVNPMGEPFDQRTYIDIFNAILKESGVEKSAVVGTTGQSVGLHTLRHTFATRALESNVDILALASILGHAQPSTTLNKYGHALPDHKRASMEKIEVLI